MTGRSMPAWSTAAAEVQPVEAVWPAEITRDWAFGEATGSGVRVCILDSGVEAEHPLVGAVARSVVVSRDPEGNAFVADDEEGDVAGHGTACAGIVRSLAPGCELSSARVLGSGNTGSGAVLLEGLRWAVEQGYHVINMSLSTTKAEFTTMLHELADTAYFQRTVLVASAHNMPVASYPWRFSSVVSVGCHDDPDPFTWYYNASPPVEFFARGLDVEVAWLGGATLRCSGNSFATPHIAGISALLLSKHPTLTPFQLKTVLALTASNSR